jgi:FAD/FMN-containing dehydrogenase
LWAVREHQSEAISLLGVPHKLDVTLPLGSLAAFASEAPAAVTAADPSARVFLFGHLGDGNIHVNVIGPAPDDDAVDNAVLSLVIAHRGSISAEHGIGRAKREWLERDRGPVAVAAMRAVKDALDPLGLLNPGVLLPEAPS